MHKVAVVTDSTAYIPEDISKELSISIVPLEVIWDMNVYKDGVDILPQEFYLRLSKAKKMPSTSQPSPSAFMDIYSKLINDGYDIVSIHISSGLSGTVDSALQAKDRFPDAAIEIIDSQTTAMAMGIAVIKAAEAAKQNADATTCADIARRYIDNSGMIFAVSTLEFLHRGGRIGGAAAFLGTVLDMKPLLEVRDGKIEAVEKVRSLGKAVDRLLDIVEQRISDKSELHLAVIHANVPEEAHKLQGYICQRFNIKKVEEVICTDASPVIGTHTGPGTIGIAYSYIH